MKDWQCQKSKSGLHNFPFTGADCEFCGVNQDDLSGIKKEKVVQVGNLFEKYSIQKKNTRIHTELQMLVDEVRKDFGETAKKGIGSFEYYMVFFTRVGVQRIFEIRSEVKHLKGEDRKKVFWWCIGQELKRKKSQVLTSDKNKNTIKVIK